MLQQKCEIEVKKQLCRQPESDYRRIPSYDIKILLGDFKAQLGKQHMLKL